MPSLESSPFTGLAQRLRAEQLAKAIALDSKKPAQKWATQLLADFEHFLTTVRHADFSRWIEAIDALPSSETCQSVLNQPHVGCKGQITTEQKLALNRALPQLKPWRKGPYRLFDQTIDTEWRSDMKWDRIEPHIGSLHGRRVLDVGCGNGYFGWRMLSQGADLVLGIDPNWLFTCQYLTLQHFIGDVAHYFLPYPLEQLPQKTETFDTVFSMGVLYHRRSPIDHLNDLAGQLRRGGELILETLVVPGDQETVLLPLGRYACMRNVWFLPSTDALTVWLMRLGFNNVRVVSLAKTTLEEQRKTEWIEGQSLENCLNPDAPDKTIEGHPAPLRATLVAIKK